MKKGSFFKVYRSLLAHDLWLAEPFTKGQAWVDLIGLVNFADRDSFYKGQYQVVRKGEIFTGLSFFVKRWKWSLGKVKRYLDMLEKAGMITQKRNGNGTTITLENYAFFQSGSTTDDTSSSTSLGTSVGTLYKNNKEIKEIKEDANTTMPRGHFVVDAEGNEFFKFDKEVI